MEKHFLAGPRYWAAAIWVIAGTLAAPTVRADEQGQIRRGFEDEQSQIRRGFEIAPVRLNLVGKNRALVGLGSYLVNSTGCNDCHTYPNWADGGNPYKGEREQINTARYLEGGRDFGVAVSANITPDSTGKPAGLDLDEFLDVMHTGHDPDHPGRLLQIMPWPLYKWKTDRDLIAMYEYLRAIPSLP